VTNERSIPYPWLIRQPDGQFTFDRETALALLGQENPNDIPEPELHRRMVLVADLNLGYIQLPPEPEAALLGDQKKAWEKLRNTSVVTANPYQTDKGEWMIYRMRLFSPQERQVLRTGLRKPGSGWECIEGGAGMMDELEMVNFESNGKKVRDLRRMI